MVFPAVAVKGSGIIELFDYLVEFNPKTYSFKRPIYDKDVEECISDIEKRVPNNIIQKYSNINPRFFVIRLLEMDEYFEQIAAQEDINLLDYLKAKVN